MQVRKRYKNINPELLYDEVKDFLQKHGATLGDSKLQTYSLGGGSSHVSRGTLVFKTGGGQHEAQKECARVHIVGSAVDETKMMLDIDEELFPATKVSALLEDLDFVFGSYEIKP